MRYFLSIFFFLLLSIFSTSYPFLALQSISKMPRGEPPFFTSNPGEKPGRQLRTRAAVAAPSVPEADAPKSPTQSKSSKKQIDSKKKSPASAATVAPKSPRQSKSTKKKENESYKKSLYDIAQELKAASPRPPPPPPVVVAPKEVAPSLAPTVSTALGTLLERKASSASGTSSSGSSSDDESSSGSSGSSGSSSDDDSCSASSQPAILTGGSNIGSGTAIVSAAELIAAVSAATNPSTEAVTEKLLDAEKSLCDISKALAANDVFLKVSFVILILILDLK
jgi:hypothetical protein